MLKTMNKLAFLRPSEDSSLTTSYQHIEASNAVDSRSYLDQRWHHQSFVLLWTGNRRHPHLLLLSKGEILWRCFHYCQYRSQLEATWSTRNDLMKMTVRFICFRSTRKINQSEKSIGRLSRFSTALLTAVSIANFQLGLARHRTSRIKK